MEDGEYREKKKCRKVSRGGERDRDEKRGHHRHTRSHHKEEKPRHKEDKPRVKEEDKPLVKEEDKPRLKDEDKPRHKDEDKPRVRDEDKPRVRDEDKPRARDEYKRRVRGEGKPRVRDEDQPRVSDEDQHRHNDEDQPRVRDEDKPRARDEYKRRVRGEDKPRATDEDQPRARDEDQPHARDEDQPRHNDEDKPRHNDEDKPRVRGEDRHRVRGADKPRGREDEETWDLRHKKRLEHDELKKRRRARHENDADGDERGRRRQKRKEERDEAEAPSFKRDRIAHRYEDSEEEEHFHHLPDDNRYWGDKRGSGVIMKEAADEEYMIGKRYYTEPKPVNDEEDALPRAERREREPEKPREATEAPKRKTMDTLMTRTGGAYIPPGKLRMMQASITDKSSSEYQRIAWEALKKSIHGHINKVNTSNIAVVARLLFKENIVRGRGLLCRSIIQAQGASPTFTNVYACLVAIINSKFPTIGELLLKRVVIRFKRAYKRNDKVVCVSSATFIAHMINQRVAHEILGLELLTLLVESPTDDSVEVAVSFLKEAGQKLGEVSSKGSNAIFDMLRNILHEGKLDKRIQYMIEVMFQVRKDGFQSFPAVTEELDLVDEEDQFTHLITFDDAEDPQDMLNVFKMDTDYITNEDKYKALRSEILDTDSESGESGGDDSDNESGEGSDEEGEEGDEEKKVTIVDQTETNLVALRKTIYLTIQSSLDFEECAHKLLKMDVKPGQEKEMCHMFLDCCAEQRTYEKFFGLLAQRFCQVNQTYVPPFEQIFMDSYNTVHRLDTNKLRNVAKFFGHLLFTDAISWAVFNIIQLNEEDTTSSSRIFIKILFQELAEYMGLTSLNSRLKDPSLQECMEGLFPRNDPKNTRFAINFFTSIGLGGLTDDLREHLKNLPKPVPISQLVQEVSSASSSSSSSEDSSESEEDSSSESEEEKKKSKKKGEVKNKQNVRGTKKKDAKDDEQSGSRKPDLRNNNRQAATREWDRGKEPIDDRDNRRGRNERPRNQDNEDEWDRGHSSRGRQEDVRNSGHWEERFGSRHEDRSGGRREEKNRADRHEERSGGQRDERSKGRRDDSSSKHEERGKEDRRRRERD